jgi:glycosyltransferase involved in cell wall biosynthesis
MNITITCPINLTGYGIVSLNIIKQLDSQNHKVSLFHIGQPEVTNQDDYNIISKLIKEKDQNLDVNAPYLKIWHQFDLYTRIGKGLYNAFPFFELDTFNNNEKTNLNIPDQVLVASSWALDVLRNNNIKTQASVVPLGVDTNIFNYQISHNLSFRDSDKFIFLNIGKWEIRKGHDILLDLFRSAFPHQKDVELWLLASETTNGYSSKEELDKWKSMYSDPRVKLFSGADTQHDIARLMAASDCGIYPSRAEGWNMELLETMAMNKPAITTNYSAHTEFCTNNNSYLVDITETEKAYDGKAFVGQGNWAKIGQKEKDDFIDKMRFVYKNKINTNKYGLETAKQYSWKNTSDHLVRCINR